MKVVFLVQLNTEHILSIVQFSFHLPLIDIHLHVVDLLKKSIPVFQIQDHPIDSNPLESVEFFYASHRLTLQIQLWSIQKYVIMNKLKIVQQPDIVKVSKCEPEFSTK